ncbi:SAS053 family DNA gyrase inhibitor [Staphylococcus epidermidis]|uniref:SAS053 family DNA gyrase inhibitor n=1 Tax=Staphylococcus epidermidis TaxID=1282 RepID=UPI0011A0711D|nr:SAS053 family protein [Staphylococcus epidermidis]
MANKKDSKLNYHEEENAMVTDLDDLKELLGKEMEQISQENDEEKLNQSHDNEVRSDLKNSK